MNIYIDKVGKMGVWDDLVANVAAYKPVKKTLILIGGSEEAQNSLIKNLYVKNDTLLREDTNMIANRFYLGYTFIQYKDNSQELLSTLQIYTLPKEFKQSYKSILHTVLKNLRLEDVLLIPLLDYSEDPNHWLRELNLILQIFQELTEDKKLPQLLMIVVNKNSRIDWDQDVHEYIQLCLRSVALRESGSLIFTNIAKYNPKIIEFISSTLTFPIKENYRINIEPNFTDYSELLIPKGSDSWGKVKTLSDEIDPESISKTWSIGEPESEFITTFEKFVPAATKEPKKIVREPVPPPNVSFQAFLQDLYERRKSKGEIFKKLSGKTTTM